MIDRRLEAVAILIAFVVGLAGCSRGDRPELGEVTGTVTLDGKPLEGALVAFYPEEGRTVGGTTDAEGFYEVMYLQGVKGTKVGPNKVEITTSLDPSDEDWRPGKSAEKVPPWYNVRTTLEANVEPGDNVIDFELTTEAPEGWRRGR